MRHEENIDEEELPYLRECLFLLDIVKNPMSTVVGRYRRLGINPKTGNRWKDFLILHSVIVPKRIITKSGWIVLFEITDKGADVLRNTGYNMKNTLEGIEHKFWKEKIAEYYKRQGYSVVIEEERNGSADIAIEKGRERIAVEIETGNSEPLNNIRRDLEAGFKSVICVPTNRYVQHKIAQDIEREGIKGKVELILAFKFDITLKTDSQRGNKQNGIL